MKRFPAFLFIVVCTLPAAAQTPQFRVAVDIAAFRYDQDRSYVELSYSFPRDAITYAAAKNGFSGSTLMRLVVNPEHAETPSYSKIWRVPVAVRDTSRGATRSMTGKLSFTLQPGRYTFLLIAQDEGRAGGVDTVRFPYEVRNFEAKGARFSDVQLCSSIRPIPADTANIFYKNTLEVVPNPSLLYGDGASNVAYYAELYDADLDTYLVKAELVSSFGATVTSRSQRKSGRHPSRVEVGSIPISTLATGVYTFILSYGDTSGVMKMSQSKKLYVYNPGVKIDSAAARKVAATIAYEFASMAEDELDNQFALARYIATPDERHIYEALSGAEAKKKFLTRFWNDRDPDPLTAVNEAYQDYMKRIQVANAQYRSSYRPGWKSDRGRVYILYGPPDYIERFQAESDTKPYEVWTYDNIQSGVQFYFVDKGGFNEFELVHSTMRNEINNPDWKRSIQTH